MKEKNILDLLDDDIRDENILSAVLKMLGITLIYVAWLTILVWVIKL